MNSLNYVQVIVDIAAADVDKIFSYKINFSIKDDLRIGQAVRVPFGSRKVLGFVIGFTEKVDIEPQKMKEINEIIIKEPLFNKKMLKLFKWIAAYYKSYLIKIIKTAVPTGVVSGRVRKKKMRAVVLSKTKEKTIEFIEENYKKAPKQAEILKMLLNNSEKKIQLNKVIEKAETSYSTVKRLVEKEFLQYTEILEKRRPYLTRDKTSVKEKALLPTPAQKKVIKGINKSIYNDESKAFLLHGVTGSGKTEVYLQVIDEVLKKKCGAIMLVPEISLTPMIVNRFYRRFGEKIAVLHSNLSLGERYDEWRRLNEGEAQIAIGARSAVFAPVKDLKVIIIDEEHENSYKQGEYPHYHAREVALKRGKIEQASVVLGSATPSFESFYYAMNNRFQYLKLPERINNNPMPSVKVIDMREELSKGNTTIFSKELDRSIKKALEKKKQILIFLNRRGYASFVLCRECGQVIQCKNCDISLTYHADYGKLSCHYCNYSQKLPDICPECGSEYIREFGIGTERIEKELKKKYTGAKVDRMDLDTTTRKGSHRRILKRLEEGKTDILVGTQMIAKGHDYPNVAVVGVITADTVLNIPDFRSAERTFQLMTQVAGRTGRGREKGRVLIQTYNPEHDSIKAARKHDYMSFYNKEINFRKELNYPPFSQMVNIIIQGIKEEEVITGARALGNFLENNCPDILELLGPSPAPISRLRQKYRWQIIIKCKGWVKRNNILNMIKDKFFNKINKDIVFNIDVDPLKVL